MKIRPVYNFLPLRKSWIGGITIYPFIFFKRKREEITDRLFRHEMEHIYQVERLGWFKFYLTYLWQNIRVGYKRNKYELEAESVEMLPLSPKERAIKDS
jgi:hypothetical protein